MSGLNIPLASYEVRWFFEGWADGNGELRPLHEWFHAADPFGRSPTPPTPVWKDWRTDIYLLLPGGTNMGLKWREQRLEIKGLAAALGLQAFSSQFQGYCENWVKWSFPEMPDAFQRLFEPDAGTGLVRASVKKNRGLRKLRVDPMTAAVEEVSAEELIHRGVSVELTNLLVDDARHCTLGFEAFPDDSAMMADFTRVVEGFLGTLRGIPLEAANSQSYPEWLAPIGP